MKKQHIIWFILGMGLLAAMSSCTDEQHITADINKSIMSAVKHQDTITRYTSYSRAYLNSSKLLFAQSMDAETPAIIRGQTKYYAEMLLDSANKYATLAEELTKR